MLTFSQSGNSPTFSLKQILTFAAGTVFGFSYAYMLWMGTFRWKRPASFSTSESKADYSYALDVKKVQQNIKSTASPIFYEVDRSVADELARKVRVLCWVVIIPEHEDRAHIIKTTWGSRCTILLFTGTKKNKDLPTITMNMTHAEGQSPWSKTKKGFTYIYENYIDSVDWFIKVDHHNYIIMENLRRLLHTHSPDEPIYFGRKFSRNSNQGYMSGGAGYMSGGAGYVLSREALKRFVLEGLPVPSKCRYDAGGLEDVEMGWCLKNVGVTAGDSRDGLGRGRFFPFDPATHMVSGLMEDIQWYWEYTNISYPEGIDCCSDTTISFHYVFPDLMYNYDYLLYGLNSRLIK